MERTFRIILFILKILIEHLMCARYHTRNRDFNGNNANMNFSLKDYIFIKRDLREMITVAIIVVIMGKWK
jgi:hypothetical protein